MLNSTRVGGILFLALSCAYGYYATEIPLDYWSRQEVFTARSMPYLVAAGGAIIATLLILVPSSPTDWQRLGKLSWLPALALLVLMSGYALVLEVLGFPLATVLFLAVGWFIMGERRPHWLLGISIPLVAGFWLLMDQLGIYLYPGDLFAVLFGGQG